MQWRGSRGHEPGALDCRHSSRKLFNLASTPTAYASYSFNQVFLMPGKSSFFHSFFQSWK